LIFYGVREVEYFTNEEYPYPTYSGTEHVLEEVEDMTEKKEFVRIYQIVRENPVALTDLFTC